VYSWVPPEVQDKILRICEEQLAPHGVAYISFNTYPGWHMRGMIRDLLRREVGPGGTAEERVARARSFLKLLAFTPNDGTHAQAWLRDELTLIEQTSDKYLFYEYLVEDNRPVYFRDFALDAARHGLQYLADAHFHTMLSDRYGPEAEALIAEVSSGIVDTEHYLDLLGTRFFRRTLLCRDDLDLDRTLRWSRLLGLWVGTELGPTSEAPDLASDEAVEEFRRSPTSALSTSVPLLKAALVALAEVRPGMLTFEELCGRARALLDGTEPAPATLADQRALGGNLLTVFAKGQIELAAWAPPIATRPGPRPEAPALVRLQAAEAREACTNLRHEGVRVDRFDRAMFKQMDGAKDVDAIAAGVLEDVRAGNVRVLIDEVPQDDPELIREVVEQKLERLAKMALILE
jgi:methyltransferase-like protein